MLGAPTPDAELAGRTRCPAPSLGVYVNAESAFRCLVDRGAMVHYTGSSV